MQLERATRRARRARSCARERWAQPCCPGNLLIARSAIRRYPKSISLRVIPLAGPQKRGKKEEYIKDEGSMTRYLMRMATADMKVKPAGAREEIEGKDLARVLERMVELKHYCERAARRVVGDAKLLSILLEAFGGKKGVLRKEGATLRRVFQ